MSKETTNMKASLETAIANSSASDYDKGNILYLAEVYAEQERRYGVKIARDTVDWSSEAHEQLTNLLDGENVNGNKL